MRTDPSRIPVLVDTPVSEAAVTIDQHGRSGASGGTRSFFLMSEATWSEVLASLKTWLIRGNVTSVQRLMTPTHACGLAQPLQDPSLVNVAALLRSDAKEVKLET